MSSKLKKITVKTIIFILSLSLAWYLLKSGILDHLIDIILPIMFLAPFLAGMLYTSFLTTPLAIAMFLVLAPVMNPILLALVAGLGAAVVDLILVKLFREDLKKDVGFLTREFKLKLIMHFLKLFKLDFLVPLIGALIIASPLPDELGLFLLGQTKLKYREIGILVYVLNTAGILLIVTPINLLS